MDRLTEKFNGDVQLKAARNSDAGYCVCTEICEDVDDKYGNVEGCDNCPIQKVFDRLAAYEDTGLMPDEIPKWTPVSEKKPKSGEHVQLCCEVRPSGRKYVCDGYYAAPKTIVCSDDGDCASEYDEEKDEYFLLEGFYEVINNWEDFSSITIDDFVTYWQPLPQPPKDKP